MQTFAGLIMQRMIFDGDHSLPAPLELGRKAGSQKELALMDDLMPLLRKLAPSQEISGLATYGP